MQQLEFQACKRPFGIYQSLAQRGLLPYQHDKLCDVNAMMQKPRKMQSDITIASELMTFYLLHLKNDIRQ